MHQQSVDYIEHKAKVTALSEKEGTVTVAVEHGDECGGCPAARLCGIGDSKKELLTIKDPRPGRFQIGERVKIRGRESLHKRAIMLCTVIPCLLLIVVMTAVFLATLSQGLAALWGIGTMILFFLLLYLGRNKIAHEFTFTIEKL